MAVRGCGSGLPGKNDRGLDLYGLLAFIQLQQCTQDRCNAKINLSTRALSPAGRWTRSARPGARATRAEPLEVNTSGAREKAARARGGATLGGGDKRSSGTSLLQAPVTLNIERHGWVQRARPHGGRGYPRLASVQGRRRGLVRPRPSVLSQLSRPFPFNPLLSQAMRVHTSPTALSATAAWG